MDFGGWWSGRTSESKKKGRDTNVRFRMRDVGHARTVPEVGFKVARKGSRNRIFELAVDGLKISVTVEQGSRRCCEESGGKNRIPRQSCKESSVEAPKKQTYRGRCSRMRKPLVGLKVYVVPEKCRLFAKNAILDVPVGT